MTSRDGGSQDPDKSMKNDHDPPDWIRSVPLRIT
jgi:hypothetical protein